MASASFEFVEDDQLQCARCERRLRRALQRVPGIEALTISIDKQSIGIAFNPVLIDSDTLGETLADLGHVVRPAPQAVSKAWQARLPFAVRAWPWRSTDSLVARQALRHRSPAR